MPDKKSFLLHLLLFVVIELLFILLLFREFPRIEMWTAIGIGHTAYWLIVVAAGVIREYVTKVRQRFLTTYLPVVIHVIIHVRIGAVTLEHLHEAEHETSLLWLVVGTVGLGGMIFRGERLIHRKYHCETHHQSIHNKCHEQGHSHCEQPHNDLHE